VTGYLVEYHDGDGIWIAGGNPSDTIQEFTGLAAGETYSFRVTAENAAGYGAVSSTGSASTYGAPGAPTNFNATAGSSSATLTWDEPASDGGSAITSYIIQQYQPGDGWTTIETLPASVVIDGSVSHIVTGLTPGQYYSFLVGATNAAGTTMTSGETVVQPYTTPSAPVGVSVTAGKNQITVTWMAPASTGYSQILAYTATLTGALGGGQTCTSSITTSCTITGLTTGTTLGASVTATNAAGDGTAGTSTSSVIVQGVPSSPLNARVESTGNGTATVAWGGSMSDGGVPLTGYKVYSNPGTGGPVCTTAGAMMTSCTVTGLINGTGYTFTVTAYNTHGESDPSNVTETATPFTLPGAPTVTSSSSDTSSVTAWFNAPASNGGYAISTYQLYCYSTNGGTSRSVDGSSSPLTVGSLTEGKNYICYVSAYTAAGWGATSNNINMTATQVDPDDYAATANYATGTGSYGATGTFVLTGGSCDFGPGDYALVAQAGYGGHAWGCEEHTYLGPVQDAGWGYYYCPVGDDYFGNGTCYVLHNVYAGVPAGHTEYSCPSGGWVSGSTCYYHYSYIASYSCPSGGNLSGTTCVRPAYWSGWNRSIS